jgi:hypothetical protein
MSWRRNFADYQNELSQKSADKLIEEFAKLYEQAASEMIPMFLKVYEEAWDVAGIKKLAPETLYRLDSYWALLDASRQRAEVLGNDIISMMNDQFHVMYADVFEGIAPGNIQLPCFISSEEIQEVIDGVWGMDKKNWRERIWIKMTVLWDKLIGALMEAIIKHRAEKKFQDTLQKEFEESRKALNSTMMIDISRIQAQAARKRNLTAHYLAGNAEVSTAAYVMSYGDEAEVNEIPLEHTIAVRALSNVVANNKDSAVRMLSSRKGGGEPPTTTITWVCETDDLVCEACKELDGKSMTIRDEDDGQELYDMLPLHPNCRCVIVEDLVDMGTMDLSVSADNIFAQGEAFMAEVNAIYEQAYLNYIS